MKKLLLSVRNVILLIIIIDLNGHVQNVEKDLEIEMKPSKEKIIN
jgi:hypothetical protein